MIVSFLLKERTGGLSSISFIVCLAPDSAGIHSTFESDCTLLKQDENIYERFEVLIYNAAKDIAREGSAITMNVSDLRRHLWQVWIY